MLVALLVLWHVTKCYKLWRSGRPWTWRGQWARDNTNSYVVTERGHQHQLWGSRESNQKEYLLKSKSVLFVWLIKWKHFLLTDPFLHSFSIALLAIFKVFSIFLLGWLYWMMGWGWTLNTDWFSRWVRARLVSGHQAPGDHLQCPVSRSQPKCVNVKEFPRSQNILYITTFNSSFLKILSFIIGKRL